MGFTRREFLESSVGASAGIAASRFLKADAGDASPADERVVAVPAGEWMANTPASAYRAYRSKPAKTAEAATWVQVDLGESRPIDLVKVYPANEKGFPGRDEHYAGEGFPVRFKIESSSDPDFHDAALIVDHTAADYPNPRGHIEQYAAQGVTGRYVRLTATRLMNVAGGGFSGVNGGYYLALGKMDVSSGGKEIAALCPVTADSTYGNDNDVAQVTRPARLGGESTFVDHPKNVTDASGWKPPVHKARVPQTGVTLEGGVFQTAMENNILYLLNSYSVDDLLRQFRERVGTAKPPEKPTGDVQFWEEDLAGSNAGRFLMAAGNTLRWINHPELRRRLDAVVEGIAQCRQPNGYIMAYPEDTIFYSERGAYTRAWLVHGLIEAGYAGNPKAFELLRGYSDWFNQCSYLPQLLRFAVQGGQGMIANTRMYFTPVGKPADIQVIQRYFQENYWMDQLAEREERAIWQYPYDRPHCYLLTNLEAYLDLYLATGDPRYLHAVEGGWELYHDKWENPGGSIAIIEFVVSPPQSYMLHAELEELCGNSFWTFLSQRFHVLDPENEKYVKEIEKSIYNVAMANQAGSQGFRYHALLVHHKERPTQMNTCCEGQGTRLIGSLPEHIYSLALDGLYVNLFEPSTIDWTEGGASLRLKMVTRFPFDPEVRLQFSAARPTPAKIRIRVPSWATREMAVSVNGKPAAKGRQASYVVLDRTWAEGDNVSFTLPAALSVERYTGMDQIPDHERYAVSFGPILLAAVGAPEIRLRLENVKQPDDLLKHLKPKPGQALHYLVEHNPGVEFMPYWQVDQEPFNCFPAIDMRAA
ncbi:MAG: beta-L-arabinofuranosidase domain-containing protein [Terriglobia bacterium]